MGASCQLARPTLWPHCRAADAQGLNSAQVHAATALLCLLLTTLLSPAARCCNAAGHSLRHAAHCGSLPVLNPRPVVAEHYQPCVLVWPVWACSSGDQTSILSLLCCLNMQLAHKRTATALPAAQAAVESAAAVAQALLPQGAG